MKTLSKIFLLIFLTLNIPSSILAQSQKSASQENLPAYIGIWEADNESNNFSLKIELKDFVFEPTGDTVEQLFGIYEFENSASLFG